MNVPLLRLQAVLDPRQRPLLTDGSQLARRHNGTDLPGRPAGAWTLDATAPADVGMDPELVERACELVGQRASSSQLCVIRRGQVVVNRSWGHRPDSLFWIFSTSKPFTAVLVHRLAERGLFGLDDRVADHWPAFGRHGKDAITIRHVLQHRTGLATTGSQAKDVAVMTNWNLAIRTIEEARPDRAAGSEPAYQFLTFGFILGELLRRVTGQPLPTLIQEEIFQPLGLEHSFLGIEDADWPRHVPVHCHHRGGIFAGAGINRRGTRRAIVPAAGISSTAADVARFYDSLIGDGTADGVRLLGAAALDDARRQTTTEGEMDQYCRSPVPWSHGFQLGGPRDADHPSPLGQSSTRRTFGHNGSNCCIGWADPDHELAVGYLTNTRIHRDVDVPHQGAVADLLRSACRR